MSKMKLDMIGKSFNRLTVISECDNPPSKGNGLYWNCRCDCGKLVIVRGGYLRSGHTKSCGCLAIEARVLTGQRGHGLSGHHLYNRWDNMMQRCYNPKNPDYLNYGASGIKVCERWHNPENFLGDMESSFQEGLFLDRINNEGHYEPSNCRWATRTEQNNNRRPLLYIKL